VSVPTAAVAALSFDVLGHTLSGTGAFTSAVLGLLLTLTLGKLIVGWILRKLKRLALKHALFAGLSAGGVSLGALMPDDWQKALGGVLDLVLGLF